MFLDRRKSQRGLAYSVELAVVTPLVLMVLLVLVQSGLWFHGRNIAQSAAAGCAERARVAGTPDPQAARALANRVLDAAGATSRSIIVEIDSSHAACEVQITAPTLIRDLGVMTHRVWLPREGE